MNAEKRAEIFRRLREVNPKPRSELEYATPFQLLISVILSAQATDVGVNKATRRLYPVAGTAKAILELGEEKLRGYISTIGLFNAKAKNVIATCRILVEEYGGEVPRTRDALEALPGVGRKTANVVLNTAFGMPTIAVDTHIFRVSPRTGQDRARGRGQTGKSRARRIQARRAPLADPARPLCVQGAQARLPAVRDPRPMRVQTQDRGRVKARLRRCTRFSIDSRRNAAGSLPQDCPSFRTRPAATPRIAPPISTASAAKLS